jgi:hypothetical protein
MLLSLALLTDLNAQVKVVNEGILTIKDDQLFHLNGSFSNYSALLLNNGDFRLTGNFISEVNVSNEGTGIYRFIGFDQQNLTLYDTLRMFNVEIDNPSGINFDGTNHLQVFGNFNFLDGIVYTSIASLTSFQNKASTSGAYGFSHIDGPAFKTGIKDFVFPIGDLGNYRPAAISELEASGIFQMEYIHETYFDDLKEVALLKVNEEGYWDVKNIESEQFPKLTLNYDENSNLFTELEYVEIVHFRDEWEIVPSISDGSTLPMGITTEERLAQFGFYTTAERRKFNPNHVVTTITQDEEDCSIRVEWVMATGSVVQNYEVEMSYDSIEFTKVGEVLGSLSALQAYTNYLFIDENLYEATTIYYRIKMIPPGLATDLVTYSSTVSLEDNCIFQDWLLYPNPVSSGENLNFQVTSTMETQVQLEIWDELGRLMNTQTLDLEIGTHTYEIRTKEMRLASAMYFLKISRTKSLKFIVTND